MIRTLLVVAALAVSGMAAPTFAADTPKGMKCPAKTMDGKWVDQATNGTVTDKCVPKSLAS